MVEGFHALLYLVSEGLQESLLIIILINPDNSPILQKEQNKNWLDSVFKKGQLMWISRREKS